MKKVFSEVWTTVKGDLRIAWWVMWRMVVFAIALTLGLVLMGLDPTEGWVDWVFLALTISLFLYKAACNDKP